jgi:chorismate mutase/prephenate dehydratase
MSDLKDARARIDQIDDSLLKLLEERAQRVTDVRRAKVTDGALFHDPEREAEVVARLANAATLFPREAVARVYREIMSACLSLQSTTKVTFLGPEGTFTHMAARSLFGLSATYLEAATIDGVFDAVRKGETLYGVVPIENSTEGAVTRTVDALLEGGVLIRREIVLNVDHCLATRADGLTAVERVYSHPQALAQCRMWLAKNLSQAQLVQTPSTAAAVREALADPRGAAIASALAAEMHNLSIVRTSIQDFAENVTRFVLIGQQDAPRTGNDKTTLAFSLKDGRGALRRVLDIFDHEEINLSRIESRPSQKKAWDYVFLVDIEGHRDDESVQRAFAVLEERCPLVRHLGSYPAGAPRG